MGTPHRATAEPASGFDFYRITPSGKAEAESENQQLRSRYLIDLLCLLATSGRSIRERELRQFMPPASLGASIGTLLEKGLIECDDRARRS